jgi:hypothetical protein
MYPVRPVLEVWPQAIYLQRARRTGVATRKPGGGQSHDVAIEIIVGDDGYLSSPTLIDR